MFVIEVFIRVGKMDMDDVIWGEIFNEVMMRVLFFLLFWMLF